MTTPEPGGTPGTPVTARQPTTEAGRRLLGWIDEDATDDRQVYATIGNGLSVGDLRAHLAAIEEEAQAEATRSERERLRVAVEGLLESGAYRCPDCQAPEGPCLDEQAVVAIFGDPS